VSRVLGPNFAVLDAEFLRRAGIDHDFPSEGTSRICERNMPMAKQEVDGLHFSGTLNVRIAKAGLPSDAKTFLRSQKSHGLISYGIMARRPPQLWIRTPTIHFSGEVGVESLGDLPDWKVGFIQSISEANYIGHYANGQHLKYRLNTDSGPLKDGISNSLFYRNNDWLRETANPLVRSSTLHDDDAPEMAFWTHFSGDSSRPHALGATDNPLVRSSGVTKFRTFLAAVNKRAKIVATLAECRWLVSWAGDFDHAAEQWLPRSSFEMIDYELLDTGTSHRNPAASPEPPPFSLFLDKAERSFEIETAEGWMPCSIENSLPAPDRRDLPTLRRWGASAG
jgi:hypothetical protein